MSAHGSIKANGTDNLPAVLAVLSAYVLLASCHNPKTRGEGQGRGGRAGEDGEEERNGEGARERRRERRAGKERRRGKGKASVHQKTRNLSSGITTVVDDARTVAGKFISQKRLTCSATRTQARKKTLTKPSVGRYFEKRKNAVHRL